LAVFSDLLLLNTVKLTHNATMKPMTYKGYVAQIEYSDEDACFIGHIAGIPDVIGFHVDNVQDLRDAFGAAVDGYSTTCESLTIPAQTHELNARLAHHRANPNEAGLSFKQFKEELQN
jgi:predicted HicB family RNase H-like nuclease